MHPKTTTLLILALSIIGLIDSAYLTWDHQVHRIDPRAESSICAPGAGCEIARFHPLSEVSLGPDRPGLPISLIGLGAYLVFIALCLMRLRNPSRPESARLTFLLSIIAVLYSAFLAFISLLVQGGLCPLCTVLYGVNFGVFLASATGLRESFGAWAGGVQGAVLSRAGVVAAGLMAMTLVAGYAIYSPSVHAADLDRREAMRSDAKGLGSTPAVSLDVAGRPSVGAADAKVHMVEFADFRCGHCASLYRVAHHYMKTHPSMLRVTLMHYPLSGECNAAMPADRRNPASCLLAYASECAHQQGYWEAMGDALFAQGGDFDREQLVALASQLGVDTDRFTQCIDAPETKARIMADAQVGIDAGVDGTPTFFLNGHRVVGSRDSELFDLMMKSVTQRGN